MSAEFVESGAHGAVTKTLTITSGKGGVGKTTLVSNIALQLGREGNKVLILDGDLGMANVDIMFEKRAKLTIFDLLEGRATIEEVLINVERNVYLIPSGSGIRDLQNMTEIKRRELLDQISSLPIHFDYLIVDTAPGIGDNVLFLNSAAQEINVVVTPDPSSIADSYALIKVMNKIYRETRFSIICNMVRDEEEGLALYRRLSDVASQYLCVSLDYKGSVPSDQFLRRATKSQQLVLKSNSNSPSSESIKEIATKVSSFNEMGAFKGSSQFFWQQFFGVA